MKDASNPIPTSVSTHPADAFVANANRANSGAGTTAETASETTNPIQELAIDSNLDRIENLVGSIERRRHRALNKLIIQIPCFNEAETLGITLDALPRTVPGVKSVEWLVIDDGSQDKTVEVAMAHGVDHVVRFPKNMGLAKAFMAGIEECLRQGADVIVNTDADNQYQADDIEKLVAPIAAGRAAMVVGARPIGQTKHFSLLKKALQKIGSWVVRKVSNADVADAPSGFRAISRETAMKLNVFNDYTYTLETLIQAGQNNMAVASVPIRTNADLRPSRLFKSIRSYVSRSALTIIRIFMTYRPLQFFGIPAALLCSVSLGFFARYLVLFLTGNGAGHVQSLILAGVLMGAGLLCFVAGLVGDLIAVNRKLLEKLDWRIRMLDEQVTSLKKHQTVECGDRPDNEANQ